MAAVVGGVVKGIGAFVKYLVSYAAEGDDVPGLKAMVPGGAFVTEINKTQPGQPGPGHELVRRLLQLPRRALRRPPQPAGVPARAGRQAQGGLRRPAVQGRQRPGRRHRLDVGDRPARGGGFVRDSLELGENDVVYHNNYFNQLPRDRGDRRLAAARDWAPVAGGGPRDRRAAIGRRGACPMGAHRRRRAARRCALRRRSRVTPRSAPVSEPRRCSPHGGTDAMPPSPSPSRGHPGRRDAGQRRREAEFARARAPLAQRDRGDRGAAHAEADVVVDANRPLSVQVVGKKNATIVGPAADVFDAPARTAASAS